ncbi:hypothetical protein D3I60_04450 [Brevibacterium permense]|nr:hypothetical protein [Brevibacterium permense]
MTTPPHEMAATVLVNLVRLATEFASTVARPTPHTCGRVHRSHRALARCQWPRAEWVMGDGPHAVLSHCGRGLTVALYATEADAGKARAWLDSSRCGHTCNGPAWHELVSLSARPAETKARRYAA